MLMRRGEDGWRLAAASLCFPSSWSLRGKIRQAAAGHPHAGARLRARHAHGRHHPPHLRQSRGRAAGRAAQLVAPGGRRSLPATVQRRPHRPRRRRGRRDFPKPTSPRTPSSASSARRCASCPARATSCSPSASISTRWRCSNGHPERAGAAAIVRRAAGRARHGPARLQGACRRPRPAGRASHGDGGSLDAGADFSFIVTVILWSSARPLTAQSLHFFKRFEGVFIKWRSKTGPSTARSPARS